MNGCSRTVIEEGMTRSEASFPHGPQLPSNVFVNIPCERHVAGRRTTKQTGQMVWWVFIARGCSRTAIGEWIVAQQARSSRSPFDLF